MTEHIIDPQYPPLLYFTVDEEDRMIEVSSHGLAVLTLTLRAATAAALGTRVDLDDASIWSIARRYGVPEKQLKEVTSEVLLADLVLRRLDLDAKDRMTRQFVDTAEKVAPMLAADLARLAREGG